MSASLLEGRAILWDTRGGGSDMLLDWAVDSGMEVGINDAGIPFFFIFFIFNSNFLHC